MLNDKLLYGVGVSLTNICPELISLLRECPNAVVHVINGVVPIEDLTTLFDLNLKILILGFKEFRRGSQYYSRQTETNKALLYEFLPQILEHFQVISFDNLAVKQLDVKRLLSAQDWKEFYMGDDGSFTMYIDMVKKEFARSSISNKRFKLLDDIEEMFSIVREQSKQNNKEN